MKVEEIIKLSKVTPLDRCPRCRYKSMVRRARKLEGGDHLYDLDEWCERKGCKFERTIPNVRV